MHKLDFSFHKSLLIASNTQTKAKMVFQTSHYWMPQRVTVSPVLRQDVVALFYYANTITISVVKLES